MGHDRSFHGIAGQDQRVGLVGSVSGSSTGRSNGGSSGRVKVRVSV